VDGLSPVGAADFLCLSCTTPGRESRRMETTWQSNDRLCKNASVNN
jgi:hypothetical protein